MGKHYKQSKKEAPTAVDLFCGAGGLTVGLKRAGFKVVAAIEYDEQLAKTYRKNHPEVKLIVRDIRTVTGKELLKITGLKKIDFVAGCPPCQGFSKLTDKHHRDDERNKLVGEMTRLVTELKPKACMMENVPGLSKRGLPLLGKFERTIQGLGYKINRGVLQMADFGVPQSRRRLVLLAGRNFEITLPSPTHTREPNISEQKMKPWMSIKEALANQKEPVTLSFAKAKGGPQKFNWHVVRDLGSTNLKRLGVIDAGASRTDLPKNLRPQCHKSGNEGFKNAYTRMSWNDVAPTMTSRCTTLSSGRFGHPQKDRTISVREAALIQTFPANYILETDKIEVACMLIGNALPCRFAEVVSKKCYSAIESHKP